MYRFCEICSKLCNLDENLNSEFIEKYVELQDIEGCRRFRGNAMPGKIATATNPQFIQEYMSLFYCRKFTTINTFLIWSNEFIKFSEGLPDDYHFIALVKYKDIFEPIISGLVYDLSSNYRYITSII